MGRRRVFIASLMWCGALALTGCTGGADSAPSEASTPAESVTDAATCTAFGDVLTITQNVDIAFGDRRVDAQEQQGWYRLATRVLDGVPTSGEGAVSDAVAALQEVAPTVPRGSIEMTGVGSADWTSGSLDVVSACADAGADVTTEGFTGG